jgi:hypothetical protein
MAQELLWALPCQGDHIGRIFAYWAIVFFGQFFGKLHNEYIQLFVLPFSFENAMY